MQHRGQYNYVMPLTSCALAHCSRSVWCWGIRSSHSSGGPADARSTFTNLRCADVWLTEQTSAHKSVSLHCSYGACAAPRHASHGGNQEMKHTQLRVLIPLNALLHVHVHAHKHASESVVHRVYL